MSGIVSADADRDGVTHESWFDQIDHGGKKNTKSILSTIGRATSKGGMTTAANQRLESARNRPQELAATNPLGKPYEDAGRKAIAAGKLSAADIARITLEAVRNERFYVLPHQKTKAAIETRMKDVLEERDPTDISRPV